MTEGIERLKTSRLSVFRIVGDHGVNRVHLCSHLPANIGNHPILMLHSGKLDGLGNLVKEVNDRRTTQLKSITRYYASQWSYIFEVDIDIEPAAKTALN